MDLYEHEPYSYQRVLHDVSFTTGKFEISGHYSPHLGKISPCWTLSALFFFTRAWELGRMTAYVKNYSREGDLPTEISVLWEHRLETWSSRAIKGTWRWWRSSILGTRTYWSWRRHEGSRGTSYVWFVCWSSWRSVYWFYWQVCEADTSSSGRICSEIFYKYFFCGPYSVVKSLRSTCLWCISGVGPLYFPWRCSSLMLFVYFPWKNACRNLGRV